MKYFSKEYGTYERLTETQLKPPDKASKSNLDLRLFRRLLPRSAMTFQAHERLSFRMSTCAVTQWLNELFTCCSGTWWIHSMHFYFKIQNVVEVQWAAISFTTLNVLCRAGYHTERLLCYCFKCVHSSKYWKVWVLTASVECFVRFAFCLTYSLIGQFRNTKALKTQSTSLCKQWSPTEHTMLFKSESNFGSFTLEIILSLGFLKWAGLSWKKGDVTYLSAPIKI